MCDEESQWPKEASSIRGSPVIQRWLQAQLEREPLESYEIVETDTKTEGIESGGRSEEPQRSGFGGQSEFDISGAFEWN